MGDVVVLTVAYDDFSSVEPCLFVVVNTVVANFIAVYIDSEVWAAAAAVR